MTMFPAMCTPMCMLLISLRAFRVDCLEQLWFDLWQCVSRL